MDIGRDAGAPGRRVGARREGFPAAPALGAVGEDVAVGAAGDGGRRGPEISRSTTVSTSIPSSKAIDAADDGKRLRGASTISQQTAKNLFLWNGRSFVRKGLEAYFTVLIELTWPKQRILEVYMNIAEFGNGIYGVGAASDAYFHTTPARLEPDPGRPPRRRAAQPAPAACGPPQRLRMRRAALDPAADGTSSVARLSRRSRAAAPRGAASRLRHRFDISLHAEPDAGARLEMQTARPGPWETQA